MYEKIVVFFMTGTGNSYKIASWFAEIARAFGLTLRTQQIKTEKLFLEPDAKTICVFTFPTHGFTAPWLILKQILRLPQGKGAAAVVLPSRAGIRIKGVSLPGMEGTAGYLTAFLLFLKGYRAKGVMGIDMPSNWTALHWGLSRENTDFIISAAEPKVKHFAKTVLSGQVYFDGIVPLLLGLLLAPLSFMYLILAQLFLAKLFFASDKCVECGLCVRVCPKQAIVVKGKLNRRPYWTYACDSCMACMNYCPHRAVEASPILAMFFYYLTTVPVAAYLLQSICSGGNAWLPEFWANILQYIYLLAAVFLAYRFLHILLHWRLFRIVFSKFSHTRYFRRYHAPNVTLQEPNKKSLSQ